jgi:ketosteroid isomerase-like protein
MQSLSSWLGGLVVGAAVTAAVESARPVAATMRTPHVEVFTWSELAARGAEGGAAPRWSEFVRSPSLFAGVDRIAAGRVTTESHLGDSLTYVVAGRGKASFTDDEAPRLVDLAPGTVLFTRAETPVQFCEVSEPLELLALFSTQVGDVSRSDVEGLLQRYGEACARDAVPMFNDVFTEDVVVVPDGGKLVRRRDAVVASLAPLTGGELTFRLEEFTTRNGIGSAVAKWKFVKAGRPVRSGRKLLVLERGGDGTWRIRSEASVETPANG